jgi:aryl-alcohol dehydrogenase-like predicted oxidoreductase
MPTRRQFLGTLAGLTAGGLLHRTSVADPPRKVSSTAPQPGDIKIPAGSMPTRTLGRTGVQVSCLGIGGYHLGVPDEVEAIRIVHAALDHGVTFFDNCWDYNEGRSEARLGKALSGGLRSRAFVMTKLDGRTRQAAEKQLEQSLQRLKTDTIDLVQIHEVIRMSDPERVFAPGGAIEALVDAKKAGKLRFIGFTGHKDPAIHLHMLELAQKNGFAFDTVQMPLNVLDPHYQSFEKRVLPVARERGVAVLGMKPLGSSLILRSGVVSADDCLRYAMSLPSSVMITGCDSFGVLEQALAVAIGFRPLDDAQKRALLAKTAAAGQDGKLEAFKTSTLFDGTVRHPEWLEHA